MAVVSVGSKQPGKPESAARSAVLSRAGLSALVHALRDERFRVFGPTIAGDAIVLGELTTGDELPDGWGVESGPGRYRLHRRPDGAVFAHSAGPQSWKQLLHPPRQPVWTSDATSFQPASSEPERYAFLGVRACDLAAISKLDTVLAGSAHPDSQYRRRRRELFIVAVGCTEPGEVCFCASMNAGPSPGPGYDLALTELITPAGSRFLVDVGTANGARILRTLPARDASPEEVADARAAIAGAAARMGRQMPAVDLRTLLRASRDSGRWQDIAERCLTCGNCTMVCPTCFCTTAEVSTGLDDATAAHAQRWASCFEPEFSFVHGGSVRVSGASRYRQWMTHKLSSWHDQFGGSGCVGCGRCIAWCPVGIDITAEAAELAADADVKRSVGGEQHD